MNKALKHLSLHWKRHVLGRRQHLKVTPADRKAGFYEIAKKKQRKPISPWAFIRVKDEIKTIEASLNSILPIINKGVIAYNECTDGSDAFIIDFCKRHPGFIPAEYPHHVIPSYSPEYKGNFDFKNSLAAYNIFAQNHIPKNEWMIKIDCDQIYDAELLKQSFLLPEDEDDVVVYSRLNLLLDKEKKAYFKSYVRPGDHWLIYNRQVTFENRYEEDDNGFSHAYEVIKRPRNANNYYPECSTIHFPHLKNYRITTDPKTENALPIETYILERADPNEIDNKIISLEWIYQVAEQISQK